MVTADFKKLIKNRREAAFSSGNDSLFKHSPNRINRERKICRAKFYFSKVKHLKRTKPKRWWNEVKQIVGMVPAAGSDDLCSRIHLNNIENMQRP